MVPETLPGKPPWAMLRATMKFDARAAVFKGDKILLVKENNGTWSLPGGWVDVGLSVRERTLMRIWTGSHGD